MNYLIHTSVEDMLKECESTSPLRTSERNSYLDNVESFWQQLNCGTPRICKECRGEHRYEAKIMTNGLSDLMSDEFFKKQFRFCNKQIVGQRVDIPRFLSGDQRCWFATKKIRREARAVRIYAPIGGLWNITPEMMSVCGSLTCAVVEFLESNGIGVELWAACGVIDFFRTRPPSNHDDDWRNLCQLIKIKDVADYTDLGYISYITGNSDFYRNIVWKSRETFGLSHYYLNNGWKHTCHAMYASTNFDAKYIMSDGEYTKDNTVVIPRIYKIKEARDWLKKFVEKTHNNNEEE